MTTNSNNALGLADWVAARHGFCGFHPMHLKREWHNAHPVLHANQIFSVDEKRFVPGTRVLYAKDPAPFKAVVGRHERLYVPNGSPLAARLDGALALPVRPRRHPRRSAECRLREAALGSMRMQWVPRGAVPRRRQQQRIEGDLALIRLATRPSDAHQHMAAAAMAANTESYAGRFVLASKTAEVAAEPAAEVAAVPAAEVAAVPAAEVAAVPAAEQAGPCTWRLPELERLVSDDAAATTAANLLSLVRVRVWGLMSSPALLFLFALQASAAPAEKKNKPCLLTVAPHDGADGSTSRDGGSSTHLVLPLASLTAHDGDFLVFVQANDYAAAWATAMEVGWEEGEG